MQARSKVAATKRGTPKTSTSAVDLLAAKSFVSAKTS